MHAGESWSIKGHGSKVRQGDWASPRGERPGGQPPTSIRNTTPEQDSRQLLGTVIERTLPPADCQARPRESDTPLPFPCRWNARSTCRWERFSRMRPWENNVLLTLSRWYKWLNSVKVLYEFFKTVVSKCRDLLVLWQPKARLIHIFSLIKTATSQSGGACLFCLLLSSMYGAIFSFYLRSSQGLNQHHLAKPTAPKEAAEDHHPSTEQVNTDEGFVFRISIAFGL